MLRCLLSTALVTTLALPALAQNTRARPNLFGALVMTTTARHDDGRVHLRVSLTRPSDGRVMLGRATPCFTAPPGLEAQFDGEPMFLMSRGGPRWAPASKTSAQPARPSTAKLKAGQSKAARHKATQPKASKRSSKRRRRQRRLRRHSKRKPTQPARVQVGCLPVKFGLAPRDQAPESTVAEVAVRARGHSAAMQIKDLFVPRRLRLRSAKAVRPGDRVEVEWTPTTDIWLGRTRATAIYLRRTHALSLRVAPADLSIRGARFAFDMPSAPPGAARIELGAGSLRAYPPVVQCDGFRRCQSGALATAVPVDAMILP